MVKPRNLPRYASRSFPALVNNHLHVAVKHAEQAIRDQERYFESLCGLRKRDPAYELWFERITKYAGKDRAFWQWNEDQWRSGE